MIHRPAGHRILHFIMRLDYPGQDPDVSDAGVRAFGDVAAAVKRKLR